MRVILISVIILLVLAASDVVKAESINFEGFPDSTILTTQFTGITFSNAIILSAGISLDEFEFPPYSGTNVASDNNGPMSISFADTITNFSAFFTYAEPLTLEGFDASNEVVASASSAFLNNEVLSGDAGSSPNELIGLSSATGISEIVITGDPFGGSFTLDDLTTSTSVTPAPEPSSLSLLAISLFPILSFVLFRRRP